MPQSTEISHNPPIPQLEEPSTTAPLSRRRFLGGLGGTAAAAMAIGVVGLEPSVNEKAAAEAAQELGPLPGITRTAAAYAFRIGRANRMLLGDSPAHPNNGDEDNLPGFIGNYGKGLPKANAFGEVLPSAYLTYQTALATGAQAAFNAIPLGGVRKLTNPQAGYAFDCEGRDMHQFVVPPAPRFSSAEEAAEMVEMYWMALLRDVPFLGYGSSPLAAAAATELSTLIDFKGLKDGGVVTPATLFRDPLPGTSEGPYISQFFWLDTPFGAELIDRRMATLAANVDHGTTPAAWLEIQKGNVPGADAFTGQRRYVLNGRDIGQWVHIDVLFQAYFNACLILGNLNAPLNPGNPYNSLPKEAGFGTLGAPYIKTLLCETATRSLKSVWFQKWQVHRRLRPEEFGGRIHYTKTGARAYPIHAQVLGSNAVARTKTKFNSYLLPLAFPEGSPTHPAYGAGHATVAGACVTILKAMFDESFEIPSPVVPDPSGQVLLPLSGATLTVGGELNKLASNVATGRNIAGVHWRSDAVNSLRLGEQIGLQVLVDSLAACNETISSPFTFTNFDGHTVQVNKNGFTVL